MKFKAKPISMETGRRTVVIINKQDADALGLHPSDRVKLKHENKELIAMVDITSKITLPGEVVTSDDVTFFFKLKRGEEVTLIPEKEPESVMYIKQKISGVRLSAEKIHSIVKDVVARRVSDLEIAAFLTALHIREMSMDEIENLSRSMVETGKTLKIPGKVICDKHSAGGVPGDKTSMIVIPIIAAAGLTIPKTSSRAITSPAGTADRFEVLAPVNLTAEEIKRIVKKTNGCLAWGGALELAPADDIFIQVEYPLGIDPLLLPSIMSKKMAVGAKYVVIDIPVGRGAKIKTVGDGRTLSDDFIELGKRLGIEVACAITHGEQPIGYAIGPALEAREALLTLKGKGPLDLIEKVSCVAGILFEMVGRNHLVGRKHALNILKSGKAEKKLREIIEEQGGNPKVKPSDIKLGDKIVDVKADKDGVVLWIKNQEIAAIAREAGAPKHKGAGIELAVKTGHKVKKGDVLFTIYAETSIHLNDALKLVKDYQPIIIGKQFEERMLLDKIPTKIPHRRLFMLER